MEATCTLITTLSYGTASRPTRRGGRPCTLVYLAELVTDGTTESVLIHGRTGLRAVSRTSKLGATYTVDQKAWDDAMNESLGAPTAQAPTSTQVDGLT